MAEYLPILVTIIGSLGGLKGIEYFVNIRNNKKKSGAEAAQAHNNVLDDYVEGWKGLYEQTQIELARKDTRIDVLYAQLDLYRKKHEELLTENTRLQLEGMRKEYARCDVEKCSKRIPPRHVLPETI